MTVDTPESWRWSQVQILFLSLRNFSALLRCNRPRTIAYAGGVRPGVWRQHAHPVKQADVPTSSRSGHRPPRGERLRSSLPASLKCAEQPAPRATPSCASVSPVTPNGPGNHGHGHSTCNSIHIRILERRYALSKERTLRACTGTLALSGWVHQKTRVSMTVISALGVRIKRTAKMCSDLIQRTHAMPCAPILFSISNRCGVVQSRIQLGRSNYTHANALTQRSCFWGCFSPTCSYGWNTRVMSMETRGLPGP